MYLLMWFFKIIKKILDALIYLSSIVTAIKTIKYCYTSFKNHKNDIINACLKILDYFGFYKKNLMQIKYIRS